MSSSNKRVTFSSQGGDDDDEKGRTFDNQIFAVASVRPSDAVGSASVRVDSNKAVKTNSSDSPSKSATNRHGSWVVLERLRSILCHPLGLPLFYAFDGKDPSTLPCLARPRQKITSKAESIIDNLLLNSIEEWRSLGPNKTEKDLTEIIAGKIAHENLELEYFPHKEVQVNWKESGAAQPSDQQEHEVSQSVVESDNPADHDRGEETSSAQTKRYGSIDILLSPSQQRIGTTKTTPYAVIEFGLNGDDWSQKLDQNVKYLDRMVDKDIVNLNLRFAHPILCAVVTVQDDCERGIFDFKIGAFLCSRKNINDPGDIFRMSLLWHAKANDPGNASKLFGRLLLVTNDFVKWREDVATFVKDSQYQYLSSSCCKCRWKEGDDDGGSLDDDIVVLRSYDHRVRTSSRRRDVYLDQKCQKDVGVGTTNVILDSISTKSLSDNLGELWASTENPLGIALWEQQEHRGMSILSTPFRQGNHCAESPSAFLPIVRQLRKLHESEFVHGDIRAYNIVFGEDDAGWLIDFDYGGKIGEVCYPDGYRSTLSDGYRIGKEKNAIAAFDDWFALGKLMFDVHEFEFPRTNSSEYIRVMEIREMWRTLRKTPSPEQINELEEFLLRPPEGTSVRPGLMFANDLANTQQVTIAHENLTALAATGTPFKKQGAK